MQQASLCDIVFFLCWIISHSGSRKMLGQNLHTDIGLQVVPFLLTVCGQWLDRLAVVKSSEALQLLPVLKTKHGYLRKKIDPVNRMLLLFKLRKDKLHRQRIARTHGDAVSAETTWARQEALLDCVLHQRAILQATQGHPKQVCVSWDPSTYGGKDIMVCIAYSSSLQKGCYCLNQLMAKMKVSDVHDSLIKSARDKKLERIEGYNELRALGKCLESINMHWRDFQVPPGFCLRPLRSNEFRILHPETGRAYIYDEDKDEAVQAHLIHCIWDPYHRSWNDCKNSAKKSKSKMWRAILELVLLFNLSYGPFGSGQFFYTKRALLEDFLSTESFNGAAWSHYQHLICQEQRQLSFARPLLMHCSGTIFLTWRSGWS